MILENDSFVAEHMAYHQLHSTAAAIGGPYELTSSFSLWDRVYHDIAHDWLMKQTKSGDETNQLLGGNISLKRSVLLKHSLNFDDAIGFGGAETGLCQRLACSGHQQLYFAALKVGHAPLMTARKLAGKAYLQGAGARWRAENLPLLEVTHVNTLRARRIYQKFTFRFALGLYRKFFDFGWKQNPYSHPSSLGAPPSPALHSFMLFLIGQSKLLTRFRNSHRASYAIVRSAWLNGALNRRIAKPE
jgi:hypothetical protein